jgi:hypothetical protein
MARIVVFEDNRDFLGIIDTVLQQHEIVAIGETYAEAITILGRLACGEVEADVIVLDGNLRGNGPTTLFAQRPIVPGSVENVISGSLYEQPMRDAKAIVDIIDHYGMMVKIIGLSAETMLDKGVEVDTDLTKDGIVHLADVVDALVPPKTHEPID